MITRNQTKIKTVLTLAAAMAILATSANAAIIVTPDHIVSGSASEFASRRSRLDVRLGELIETPWRHKEARRLVKRLRRHRNELFTFLDEAGVPFDNNHAERAIRPAVLIRKNSYSNRSRRGADAQAVLMSVYRTLKQRGYHPIDTIVKAIENYLTTGTLPSLPAPTTTDG